MDLLPSGFQAPEFEASDEAGKTVRLGDFRGRPVVLFFYPEDDTPGCVAEACGFRDLHGDFEREGIAVLGVSTDDAASHERFAAKHRLPYRLLADTDGSIATAYGALRPESGGRPLARRVTYVLAPDGRVAATFPRVDPATHADEVLAAARRVARPAQREITEAHRR